MKTNEATIFVFIASIIIGILISLNINFRKINNKVFLTPAEYQEAYEYINKLNRDISGLRSKYNEQNKKLNKYIKNQDDKSEVTKEMEKELFNNEMSLGNVDLEGEGVTIKLQDVGFSTTQNVQDPEDQKSLIIHDTDIMNLINELKYSGAEVISINDERITDRSDIFCWGPFIELDKVKIFSPFTIKVIGDKESIYSYFTSDVGYITFLHLRGINATITKEEKVQILSKGKKDEYKYIKEIKK
ncbi:DUF881 domain-containing protein [Clostridium sp. MB40-C1]|uniref:DUF881 domain-containing protein n=1 Tax=Clostridium sp. MB40-C1 TaxID=3070996 RepID=UPI0027DEE1B1|nr:DUF881 domain-containing protein [Clostridium sp. MB40-C1]WMJ81371.1 DUF881 domain-containing protein [Clostridium sp. MB40-C1]